MPLANILQKLNRSSTGSDPESISMLDELGRTPLLSDLSPRELKIIADIVHHRSYSKGEFIFKKGQPGAAMFVIKKGTVKIQDVSSSDEKKVVELGSLGSGSFFGELALLDDAPRSAYARAATAVETYALFRDDINKILNSAPAISSKIYFALARIIGQRLKQMNVQHYVNDYGQQNNS